ncbi:ABC-type transport system involved in multi-copper enzyme maturation permease subunit [Nakamurella sp. UYEF19]|uniref:ABC transporter permease n=1 Tax=Nakamurella sp. UYEF19 TaxID=1756392 RepID=UPI003398BDFF
MNTTIQTASETLPQDGLKVTPRRVIASEWTKFHTVRSTTWTLLIAVILTVGVGALIAATIPGQLDSMSAADLAAFDATDTSLSGVVFAQLALGILGVLFVSAEYSTGMIRSTLTVIPRRLPMLWAKLVVFAIVTFVLTLTAALVAFLLGQALLSSDNLDVALSAPGTPGKILGAALYVTLAGMIGVAVGSLLRNTAAGISTYVGVFMVVPLVAQALPATIGDHLIQYLPSNAGAAMFSGTDGITNVLTPLNGFLVLAAFTAVLVGTAAWRLKTRDA